MAKRYKIKVKTKKSDCGTDLEIEIDESAKVTRGTMPTFIQKLWKISKVHFFPSHKEREKQDDDE